MIKFGTITNKTLSVNFTKESAEGYKVAGNATYDKDNRPNSVTGTITDADGRQVACFHTYGEGEYARVNLTDCMTDRMAEAAAVANETLEDLAKGYQEDLS